MKKGVLYASVIAIVFAIVGCSKYKVASFVMPSWDTQFSAPLFNRTYTLQEILHKDSVIVSGGDTTFLESSGSSGMFQLFKSQPVNDVTIGDNLKINGLNPTYVSQSPSDFALDSPPTIHYVETPAGLPSKGTTAPVPPIPATSADLSPDSPFQNFTSATISSGDLQVTIHNGYPATMNFPDSLRVRNSSGAELFPVVIPGDSVPANGTVVVTQPLDGKTLPNNPNLFFTYSSPGSPTSQTYESDTLIGFSFDLLNIKVSSANAKIPPQPPVIRNKGMHLTDSNMVQSASLDSGFMSITVTNQFPFSAPIHLVISSLRDQTGNPLTLDFTLDSAGTAGSTHKEDVPLQGYNLEMADANGNPTDTVRYTVTAEIPGSGGQFVDISTSDSVKSSFTISQLKFSAFKGVVHLSNPIKILPDTQTVSLGDFRDKFSGTITYSDSTKLVMDLQKTGGYPWLVEIKFIPSSSTLNLPPVDSAVVTGMVYPNQINIIRVGPALVSALNNYSSLRQVVPDRFVISGHVIVNPTYVEGTIQKGDVMTGTAALTMPLDLGLKNAVYIDTTKTPVINDSSTAAKMENVDSGRVVFEINNGLPLRLAFITQLIDTTTGQVVGTLPADSIIIPAATEFNSDGSVKYPVFSKNQVIISHDQAVELGRCYMRMGFRVLTPPDRATVFFTKNNSISIKAYANFAFKVDKNLVGK